jgi:predicted ATP-grasp superfamily ATP-dependent carboligase
VPGSRPFAVVVGLGCITGLQTARILKSRGVRVVGVADDRKHFCCRTRAVEHVIEASDEGLVVALERLGERLPERAVLFPCTDKSVRLISRHRTELEGLYHIVLPDPDTVDLLLDKAAFHEYAAARGYRVPLTRVVADGATAQEAAEALTFPCSVKPAVKTPRWEEVAPAKAFRVTSPDELVALCDRLRAWAPVLVAQEWVQGDESNLFSCNCYFDRDSAPLVTFVARKLRQWPLDVGTSSLGEECRDDTVLEVTVKLFEELGLQGLGYLELKRDERSGELVIIEPNVGRPTGRSAIAEAGGVELLYTAYCDAAGLPLPSERVQRFRGAKWIYWRADTQAAIIRWRRGELTLRDWRRSIRGPKYEAVLSWKDPIPFVLDGWQTSRKLAAAAWRTRAAPVGGRLRGARAGAFGEARAPGAQRQPKRVAVDTRNSDHPDEDEEIRPGEDEPQRDNSHERVAQRGQVDE